MDSAELVILLLNVVFAVGCGIPVARMLYVGGFVDGNARRAFGLLLLVYIMEAAAFAGSMATSVMSIALAMVWGILLGLRLRKRRISPGLVSRLSGVFALYTSLPALSFLSVPLVCALSGWSVTDAAAGRKFGIPEFLPWPASTILGFCLLVAFGTMILKLGLTVAIVRGMTVGREDRSAVTA